MGETPVRVHLVLTSYMFSLAAFIPMSGWLADRFGARLIFRIAMAIFTLASLSCGFSGSLLGFVIARICQGIGGAMMVPVGRLILLRSVEKKDLMGALATMSIPAMVGPIMGPFIGGFLTSYLSWRWIFWVNLPIGVIGIVLVTIFIEDTKEATRRSFDALGVTLLSLGLSGTLFGMDAAASNSAPEPLALGCVAVGLVSLALYARHARRRVEPAIDLSLLRIPTLNASMSAGLIFRIGTGAVPFLLPLFLQTELGYTPIQSGATTFVSAVGALGIRTLATRIYRLVEFRALLVLNALVAAIFIAACALFRELTWYIVIALTLFFGGVFRALEMFGVSALTFADLSFAQMSHGTTLSTMSQRLSQSIGVAIAAFVLHLAATPDGLPRSAFEIAFVTVAAISASASLFFTRLSRDAGAALAVGPRGRKHREEGAE